jgi:hypothetical protein
MNGAFIGQHGSWNRKPLSGYKVIFVPFSKGKPSGRAEDVLTAFVNDKGDAQGRPVGVAIDRTGALLVADDVGNTVWRVQSSTPRAARKAPQTQTSAPQPAPPPPAQQESPASPSPEPQPPDLTSRTEAPSRQAGPESSSDPQSTPSLNASP